MATTSLISTAINVFAAPGEAYAAIQERPRPVFPLVVTLAGLVTVTMLSINNVDLGWYIEQQLRASAAAATMSEADISDAADAVSSSPGFIGAIGSFTSSLVVVIITLLFALYLWAVSSFAKHGIQFRQAFGLMCWCGLPSVLGFLASIVNLFANDVTFMPQHLINPLSFGALFNVDAVQAAAAGGAAQIMLGLDLTFIWTAVLLVLGYQAWSRKSLTVAASVVLAPYVLLIALGIWRSMN